MGVQAGVQKIHDDVPEVEQVEPGITRVRYDTNRYSLTAKGYHNLVSVVNNLCCELIVLDVNHEPVIIQPINVNNRGTTTYFVDIVVYESQPDSRIFAEGMVTPGANVMSNLNSDVSVQTYRIQRERLERGPLYIDEANITLCMPGHAHMIEHPSAAGSYERVLDELTAQLVNKDGMGCVHITINDDAPHPWEQAYVGWYGQITPVEVTNIAGAESRLTITITSKKAIVSSNEYPLKPIKKDGFLRLDDYNTIFVGKTPEDVEKTKSDHETVNTKRLRDEAESRVVDLLKEREQLIKGSYKQKEFEIQAKLRESDQQLLHVKHEKERLEDRYKDLEAKHLALQQHMNVVSQQQQQYHQMMLSANQVKRSGLSVFLEEVKTTGAIWKVGIPLVILIIGVIIGKKT